MQPIKTVMRSIVINIERCLLSENKSKLQNINNRIPFYLWKDIVKMLTLIISD